MDARQAGKFYLSDEDATRKDASRIFALMEFVPYWAEHNYCRRVFNYEGISSLFDTVSWYASSPEYKVDILTDLETDEITGVTVTNPDGFQQHVTMSDKE